MRFCLCQFIRRPFSCVTFYPPVRVKLVPCPAHPELDLCLHLEFKWIFSDPREKMESLITFHLISVSHNFIFFPSRHVVHRVLTLFVYRAGSWQCSICHNFWRRTATPATPKLRAALMRGAVRHESIAPLLFGTPAECKSEKIKSCMQIFAKGNVV